MSALAVAVDEWPGESALEFAVGVAAQQPDPLPGTVELLRRLGQRLGEPQLGTTRACFLTDDWVVKVPLRWEGETANFREAAHRDPLVPLATCRLHESRLGPVLLWMERVTPARLTDTALPRWAQFIDCAQVGYTAAGRLVTYDL